MVHVGSRVFRGPQWRSVNEDGGEGHLGRIRSYDSTEKTVKVKWENMPGQYDKVDNIEYSISKT